ncbi:MAG: 6-carboxytetrahydropterin synthase [Phycisphaerae bacterium]|jgi:6-pyruvoyltetrahydropterin/6-carboxytetrahydropterin synthase
MYKLARQIRFAINPFAESMEIGENSYCAKPTTNVLGLYLALWVQLESKINPNTGFVVNVVDIDRVVRDEGVKIFDNFIKQKFSAKQEITFEHVVCLLSKTWSVLENKFLPAKISNLTLEIMPARKLAIRERNGNMLYFSEKFEFAASHTLWNKKFTNTENDAVFGKCANRTGHGHNYIVEVTVKSQQSLERKRQENSAIKAGEFEAIVKKEFISIVDHKNLNTDVPHFAKANPTVENISEFAFNCLNGKFSDCTLDSVTIWESDRTFCTCTSAINNMES